MTQQNTNDDLIPNLVVQFRKAIDLDGNTKIVFKNGTKETIPLEAMYQFLTKYSAMRPVHREEMQAQAVKSKTDLYMVIDTFQRPAAPKSIYI